MKTVLITGATSGIGKATAVALAFAGHDVIATGRNADALAELERLGAGRIRALAMDVQNRDQISRVADQVLELTNGHGVDVLVNNAGFGSVSPISEVDDAELRAQYETNVFGLVAVTQALVPAMRERGAGTIINVSSVGGRLTLPFMGGYNSTKYAVESISDAMRRELHAFGIKVALVEPGLINTNFTPRATTDIDRWQQPGSPYAASFAHAQKLLAQAEAMGVPPERIAKVIHRIVETKRPRARYVAPLSAWFSLALARALPTSWVDAALRAATRLRRRDLRMLPASASASASATSG